MEEVEVPPGLIRTWKATVLSSVLCAIAGGINYYIGHSSARVVEKEVRVEMQPPACRDEMIRIEDAADMKHISCTHPDQHGAFNKVSFQRFGYGQAVEVPYLVCTCPHAQLDLPDAGAK